MKLKSKMETLSEIRKWMPGNPGSRSHKSKKDYKRHPKHKGKDLE